MIITLFHSLLLLFLLTLISLPSLSFCDDCPFPCLPPPPPPLSPPPPPPQTPLYNSPPPPYIPTPSYRNYPPPPFNQPPSGGGGSNGFGGAQPPPPNPILPYFPWYYNSPNSGSANLIPVCLVMFLSLFGLVVPEFLFF